MKGNALKCNHHHYAHSRRLFSLSTWFYSVYYLSCLTWLLAWILKVKDKLRFIANERETTSWLQLYRDSLQNLSIQVHGLVSGNWLAVVSSSLLSQMSWRITQLPNRLFSRLNKIISARSHSFLLYSEPIYKMTTYYRDEMQSRRVCYSSADLVRFVNSICSKLAR